jgi:hypothetical protein
MGFRSLLYNSSLFFSGRCDLLSILVVKHLTIPLKTDTDVDKAVHKFTTLIQPAIHNNTRTPNKKTQKGDSISHLKLGNCFRGSGELGGTPRTDRLSSYSQIDPSTHHTSTELHDTKNFHKTLHWMITRSGGQQQESSPINPVPFLFSKKTVPGPRPKKTNTFARSLYKLVTLHNFDSKIESKLSCPLPLSLPPKHLKILNNFFPDSAFTAHFYTK